MAIRRSRLPLPTEISISRFGGERTRAMCCAVYLVHLFTWFIYVGIIQGEEGLHMGRFCR
jgi:hypothetical protein